MRMEFAAGRLQPVFFQPSGWDPSLAVQRDCDTLAFGNGAFRELDYARKAGRVT